MPRWGRCDYRQLKKLKKKLEKLQQVDLDKFSREAVSNLSARLLRSATIRNDALAYDTGFMRDSWKVTRIYFFDGYYVSEVYNDAPYAMYVEYGHRTKDHTGWVHGKFILTVAEKNLEEKADKIVERMLIPYLKDVFG